MSPEALNDGWRMQLHPPVIWTPHGEARHIKALSVPQMRIIPTRYGDAGYELSASGSVQFLPVNCEASRNSPLYVGNPYRDSLR